MAVVFPNKDSYSETFIRTHIEKLPAKVETLHGGWFPTHRNDDRPFLPKDFFHQAFRYASYKLRGVSAQHFRNQALRDYLRRHRVDAVLAEYGPTGASIMESCVAAGVPLIVHFHGFDAYDRRTLEQFGSGYERMFSVAAAIIAVSHDMERQLLCLGAPRDKLFYSPCGVDTSAFSGADPASVPPVFVAVGRFVDKKAPHLTLLSFKGVVDAEPAARLIMVGDGELRAACEYMAKALGIAGAVEFLGARPNADVAQAMRKARAFVQHSVRTSYGDSEGTPVAVLEAGSSGLPAVATRHGGIVDVVEHGETGFLVDEGDVEGMTQAMLMLAREPRLAGALGEKARARINRHFNIEGRIDALWKIIQAAIGRASVDEPLSRKAAVDPEVVKAQPIRGGK